MKKFLTVLFLVALLPLCYGLTAHADETYSINVGAFDYGRISKVNASGSISLAAGQAVGYDINLPAPASEITLVVATGTDRYTGPVEIRLDSETGPLVGKFTTVPAADWGRATYTVTVTMDISGKHQIWFVFQGLSSDFVSATFSIQDPSNMYEGFSNQADAFNDIADSPLRTQINMLSDLGILTKGQEKFEEERLVTKRAFLRAAGAFYQDTVLGLSDQQLFADVGPEDSDYNLIKWLCGTGVLEPDPYANLSLDSSISFDEALGYLVSLLEYDDEAVLRGGVYQTATRLGILKGVSVSSSSALKNKDMVKLLWNTLRSKYNDTVSVSSNGLLRYQSQDDVLEYTGLVSGGESIIYATQNENIYAGNNAPVSAVLIDNEVYYVGKTNAAKYLGFKCIYYYSDNDGKKTLLAARPATTVQYTYLSSQDVEFEKINDNMISYYKGDKEKECRIAGTAIIVYNGALVTEPLESLIEKNKKDKFNGKILLIDNDNDNRYDVVKVDHARTIVFGGCSQGSNGTSVYDLLEKESIEAGSDARVLVLYGDNGGAWSNAELGSVMDAYISDDHKLLRFYPVTESVTGVVAEISRDSSVSVIMEDGSAYEAYDSANSDVVIGETITLKLNSFGQYISYTKAESAKIGIVLGVGLEEEGIDKYPRIRLLTEQNDRVVFDFAKRVYCDGYICRTPEEIFGGNGNYPGISPLQPRDVVLYNTDSNGKIIMIDTLTQGAGGKYDILKKTLNKNDKYRTTVPYVGVIEADTTPKAILRSNYKSVSLPVNGNEDEYEFFKFSGNGPVTGYSTQREDSFVTDLLVMERPPRKSTNERVNHMILTKRIERINDKGESEIVLEGYDKSGKVSYVVDNYTLNGDVEIDNSGTIIEASELLRAAVAACKPGDMIQPSIDTVGRVSFLALHYFGDQRTDPNFTPEITDETPAVAYEDSLGGIYAGTVEDIEDNYIKLSYTSGDSSFIDASSVTLYAVKINGIQVYVDIIAPGAIKVGDKIVVSSEPYSYKPGMAVIYIR